MEGSSLACKQNNINDDVITEIGASTKFKEKEINDAIDTVKSDFDFKGCALKKVWYNEEKSNYHANSYLANGKGSINGAKVENVIVLLSDFDVDSLGGDGSFEPNSTYGEWQWVLIRDDKKSDWKIDDWGN